MEKINITVFTEEEKKKQGDLFGIFFEDLNHAADGGLYGELIRNRSFEFDAVDREGYHSLTAWTTVERGDSVVRAHVETTQPLNPNNRHYLVLEVLTDGEGGGIRNDGYENGVPVKEGCDYHFSCYYRLRRGADVPLEIRLEDKEGTQCYAQNRFVPKGGEWQRYECTLKANKTDHSARLVLLAHNPVDICLDMISLFPADTFLKRKNGLRADIAVMLSDMKPRFMRFPGGCLIHIGSLNAEDRCAMYRWKKTLGPVEKRPTWRNTWRYNQTLGLGFFEYFMFCEDIGAEPLPVISAGYDPHSLRAADLSDMQEWIDEALDLIEFANGGTETTWGSVRAQMGHPESFQMKYLAIGNEEVGDAFFERYEIILEAVKEKYPEINVINSAGAGSAGSEFDKGWKQARRTQTSYVDEHFYQCPEWFIANADRYESYEPSPKAFLGEYASKNDSWKSALAEAAFMTGMEKAEGVGLACYAPMLCNVNYKNWDPNLLYFDNHRVFGTPSYYVQKLFMNHQGDVMLRTVDNMEKRKKKSPILSGQIGMSTQRACVDISEFRFMDMESGKTVELPNFMLSSENTYHPCMDTDSRNYSLSFRFRKKNGGCSDNLEGLCSFELEFAGRDRDNKLSWSIDGWQRHTSVTGFCQGHGADMGLYYFETELNREYEAKLVVEENIVRTYIDGVLYCDHICKSAEPDALYYSAVGENDGTVIVKAVNAEETEKEICIDLNQNVGTSWNRVLISSMEGFLPEDRNSFEEPQKVAPTEKEYKIDPEGYTFTLQGSSFAVLRFKPEK